MQTRVRSASRIPDRLMASSVDAGLVKKKATPVRSRVATPMATARFITLFHLTCDLISRIRFIGPPPVQLLAISRLPDLHWREAFGSVFEWCSGPPGSGLARPDQSA